MAATDDREPIEGRLGEAIARHRAGQLREAESLYLDVLGREPDQADALNNLAVLYQSEGRPGAATPLYARLLAVRPDSVECLSNYGVLLRDQGRHAEAVAHLGRAVALRPDYVDAHYNLGTTFLGIDRPDLALEPLRRAATLAPARADIHANLARALDAVGQDDAARAHGLRTLELKDDQACDDFRRRGGVPFGPIAPRRFDPDSRGRNIIAFSLWGADPRYTEGAVANAALRPTLYPGWTCRYYVDRTVPAEVVGRLELRGTEVVMMPDRAGPSEGLFWRFFPAGDPNVDRFLCRDCDSRLNTQERAAVEAWLRSDRPFHAMRDAVFHTELILAGLWGGVGGSLPGIEAASASYARHNPGRWADQDFLRTEIWPRIKGQILAHDSNYRFAGAVDFPAEGRRVRPLHVGAGEPP
jgi:Tfp pilus assembly protein PilF